MSEVLHKGETLQLSIYLTNNLTNFLKFSTERHSGTVRIRGPFYPIPKSNGSSLHTTSSITTVALMSIAIRLYHRFL